MSDGTKIEWTDVSWNPIRATLPTTGDTGWHCERVSPGCQNCYAETFNQNRFGTRLPYTRPSRDVVAVWLDDDVLVKPLRWRKPRRVFVCSMTDLFGEWATDDQLDRVFAVMALTPHITYQVLTKRPERMRTYLSASHREGEVARAAMLLPLRAKQDRVVSEIVYWGRNNSGGLLPVGFDPWPLPNVWVGVSVEDQQRADERIPILLETPAAVRFLSCEPLLGPVTLHGHPVSPSGGVWFDYLLGGGSGRYGEAFALGGDLDGPLVPIDWVIVGGESGPGARPCDVGWIRGIVQQCEAAGVPVFVKQLGSKPYVTGMTFPPDKRTYGKPRDRKGGDPSEWPEDLRIRDFPEVAS